MQICSRAKPPKKNVVAVMIALATGGAWVFYFTDAPALLGNLLRGQAHPVAYATIAVMTAITFLFGGFMREQICIYACPWPRIQGAMMDEDTLTVAYREWRGEPRGKITRDEATKSSTPPGEKGDCIDCFACVNVCPMGIDIRNGQQLECITCALCIDACDEIMDRIGKPRGLIDYMALKDETAERVGNEGASLLKHVLRPRTLLYFGLWSLIGVGLVMALFMRSPFDLNVTPVRNPIFVTLADGSIRNTYELRLRNKQNAAQPFTLAVTGPDGGQTDLALSVEGAEGDRVMVPADSTATLRVYLTAATGSALTRIDSAAIRLLVSDPAGVQSGVDTVFHGDE